MYDTVRNWAGAVVRALETSDAFFRLDEFCQHVDLFVDLVSALGFLGCTFRPLCAALLSAVRDWDEHQCGRECDTGRSSARRLCRSMVGALRGVKGGRRLSMVLFALRIAGGRQWVGNSLETI